jgi:hypothetical protein
LIALIANARRSFRLVPLRKLALPFRFKPSRFDSAVYGPSNPEDRTKDWRWTFRKDQFCFKRIREP